MAYLIPVYEGQQRDNEQPAGGTPQAFIVGFTGAKQLSAFRFQASSLTRLAAPANARRRTITIKNEGAVDLFIGGEEVTWTTGYRLAAGDAITIEMAGEVWVVTESSTCDVYMLAELD